MTVLSVMVADPMADAVLAAPWEQWGLSVSRDPLAGEAVLVIGDSTATRDSRPVLYAAVGDTAPAETGVVVIGRAPRHEIRIRREPGVDPRASADLLTVDRLPIIDKVADDVIVLATADLRLATQPVLTWRPATGAGLLTVGSEAVAWADDTLPSLVQRWLRRVTDAVEPPPIRVGLLGYGAIGHQHNRAVQAVAGLELAAVCDVSAPRISAARELAPHARAYDDGSALLDDADVDLVVVSTPPDSHARWAMAALDAGKHVVLEKPMALTAADCDAVLARAEELGRTVAVFQNRRWDPDFLVLRSAVETGRIGELFHLEAFVGGYGHPCNYWHSDAAVSGGAIFDWGSHFLDQVLLLMGTEVATVTARNHKRLWHDVSNADHSRVTLAFADGREATFVHSDAAAAMKPKWYALGTAGAVVGDYVTERVVSATEIGTVTEHRFAPADAPARMSLHRADGVTALTLPEPPAHPFHTDLARHLLEGVPMSVRAEQSRTVVAVMEAAEASAADDARPVVP